MRLFIFGLVLLCSSLAARAQIFLLDQSPSSTQWKTIENDFVKVIYPETFKSRAVYVANLIQHYSEVVGLSYGIRKPRKVTLIIRDQMAEPNGFVTVAPRRTEWYGSANYSPIVGATEWYQTLSIHEYRHVQQGDAFNQHSVKWFDAFFGDIGIALADAMVNKSWMKEGDAVYAETKYTDAGRGRSPRFMARLKGLLMGRATPTYDQFISGSYQDSLVNQYVYGYILISRAYQKFGDDFWGKVNDRNSRGPHPWRFERAFRAISGVTFKQFYDETFAELRMAWAGDAFPDLKKAEFSVSTDPKRVQDSVYFVRYDLNHLPALYRQTGNALEKVVEIPYAGELGRLDYSDTHAVYSDFLPHPRFGFQGYSDLVLIDLQKGSREYITSDLRLYNPHFGADGKTILAAEYLQDQTWQIQEFDLSGKRLRNLKLAGLNLVEATAVDRDGLIAFALDKSGYRSLIVARWGSDSFTTVLPGSRNNLFSLHGGGREILFEAEYKGAVEIMKLNVDSSELMQCTQSRIASYSPSFASTSSSELSEFYYVEEFPYGQRLQKADLKDCKPFAKTELTDYRYLGTDPSDAYNAFPPVRNEDQESYYSKDADRYKEQDYSGFDARAFTPHSWGLFVGRGVAANVTTDNYLRDFGSNIAVGVDPEEGGAYGTMAIDFKRYWPVISLLGDVRSRVANVMNSDEDLTWRESALGSSVLLPYQFKHHMYSGAVALSYSAKMLRADTYRLDDEDVAGSGSSQYVDQAVTLQFALAKSPYRRSILAPWSLSLSASYEDVDPVGDEPVPGSHRTYGHLDITTPGLFQNNSILLSLSGQENAEGMNRYLFPAPILDLTGYVYSRGYEYKTSDSFAKASANYMFPVSYPDLNAGLWIYVNRAYVNVYYDHTEYSALNEERTLRSSGAELILESKLFRFLPMNLGIRYIHKRDPDEDVGELFLGTYAAF